MTCENHEAEGVIIRLVEVLSRIAAATPGSTNSRTAEDMASWVYAVASTGLDMVKNRAATPVPNDIQIVATPSVEALATLQAFRDGAAAGETRLDLVDNGSLAKAIDEVLARLATNEKVSA